MTCLLHAKFIMALGFVFADETTYAIEKRTKEAFANNQEVRCSVLTIIVPLLISLSLYLSFATCTTSLVDLLIGSLSIVYCIVPSSRISLVFLRCRSLTAAAAPLISALSSIHAGGAQLGARAKRWEHSCRVAHVQYFVGHNACCVNLMHAGLSRLLGQQGKHGQRVVGDCRIQLP